MQIHFSQIYITPGVSFDFKIALQRYLSDSISPLVTPSEKFVEKYGEEWSVMIRISAKRGSIENELRGPTVYRRASSVEFTVFLPFDQLSNASDVGRGTLVRLLDGTSAVLTRLGLDPSRFDEQVPSLVRCLEAEFPPYFYIPRASS